MLRLLAFRLLVSKVYVSPPSSRTGTALFVTARSAVTRTAATSGNKKKRSALGRVSKPPHRDVATTTQTADEMIMNLVQLRNKRLWAEYRNLAATANSLIIASATTAAANSGDDREEALRSVLKSATSFLRELLHTVDVQSIGRMTKEAQATVDDLANLSVSCSTAPGLATACQKLLHLSKLDLVDLLAVFALTSIAARKHHLSKSVCRLSTTADGLFESMLSAIRKLPAEVSRLTCSTQKLRRVNKVLHFGKLLLQNDREFSVQQRDAMITAVADAVRNTLESTAKPGQLLLDLFLPSTNHEPSAIVLIEEFGEVAGKDHHAYGTMMNALLRLCSTVASPATGSGGNLRARIARWLARLPANRRQTKHQQVCAMFTKELRPAVLLALVVEGAPLGGLLSSPLGTDLTLPQLVALTEAAPASASNASGSARHGSAATTSERGSFKYQPLPKDLTNRILSVLVPSGGGGNDVVMTSGRSRSLSQEEAGSPAAVATFLSELVARGQTEEAIMVSQKLIAAKHASVASLSSIMKLIDRISNRLSEREAKAVGNRSTNAEAEGNDEGKRGEDDRARRALIELSSQLTSQAASIIQVSRQRLKHLRSSTTTTTPLVVDDDDPGNLLFATCSLIAHSAAVGVKSSMAKTHFLVALLMETLAMFAETETAGDSSSDHKGPDDLTAAVVNRCREMVATAASLRISLALSPDGSGNSQQLLHDAVGIMLSQIESAATRSSAVSGEPAVVRLKEKQVHVLGECYTTLYTSFAIEVERGYLQGFRSRVLEPAIMALMLHRQLTAEVTATFAAVACNPFTAHSASDEFVAALAKVCGKWETSSAATKTTAGTLAGPATDVLVAAATVATNPGKRESFAKLMAQLSRFVKPAGAIRILAAAANSYDRANSSSILPPQIDDLALAIASVVPKRTAVQLSDVVHCLRHLHRLGIFEASRSMPLIQRIYDQRDELTLGQCGIVAGLLPRFIPKGQDDAFNAALLESLRQKVLAERNNCSPADTALVVRGFSMLGASEQHRSIREGVLAAYILRVMTVAPQLDAHQVVRCIQSFAAGEVVQTSLFGLLLSRAADLKGTFSVPLAVDLVHTAVAAVYDDATQRACITAAQSVFLFVVGHLLQNDLGATLVRGRNAELLLGCLESVAPRERIADDVLRVVSQHIQALPVPGLLAALALIAARRGTDVTSYQTITRHCIDHVIGEADKHLLAQLTLLLVRCGCRGSELFTRVEKRCEVLLNEFDGPCVASICDAYQEARYENTELIAAIVENLVPTLAPGMTSTQILAVMSVMFTSHTQHPNANYALFGRLVAVMKGLDSQQVVRVLKIASSLRVTRNRKFSVAVAERVNDLEAEFVDDPTVALHTAHNLIRIKAHEHPVVTRLLDVVFVHRAVLLKRQLLMEIARSLFECDGVTPDLHPMLHAFAVKGDIIMADGKAVSLESMLEGDKTKGESQRPSNQGETEFPPSPQLGKLFAIKSDVAAPRVEPASKPAVDEAEKPQENRLFSNVIARPRSTEATPEGTTEASKEAEKVEPLQARTPTRRVARSSKNDASLENNASTAPPLHDEEAASSPIPLTPVPDPGQSAGLSPTTAEQVEPAVETPKRVVRRRRRSDDDNEDD